MLIRLGDLRRFIREEVERNVRWSAGLVPGGIGRGTDNRLPAEPLPGLGPSIEGEHGEEEEEGDQR